MSLRDRARAAKPFASEIIDVPQWDSKVEVRSMSLAEKMGVTVEAQADGETDLTKLLAKVVVATAFDPETGERAFTDDDIEWLKTQPSGLVESLATAGFRVSGLTEDALEEAKKDSSTTRNDGTSSS